MTTQIRAPESKAPALYDDASAALQDEIGRLPDRFRAAVVLCYLEGQSHENAAALLACPVGTIKSRLATAREKLRRRLTRRGLGPAVIPALSSSQTVGDSGMAALSATVPPSLIESTLRGALQVEIGKTGLAGVVAAESIALMRGTMQMMTISRLVVSATVVVVSGLAATGAGIAAYHRLGPQDAHAAEQISSIDPGRQPLQNKKAGAPSDQPKPPQAPVSGANPDLGKQAIGARFKNA